MKKIIVLTLLLVNIVTITYSQPAVTAGFSFCNNYEDDKRSNYLPGFYAGFSFDVGDDTRQWAFRPGIGFGTKGWRINGDVDEKQLYTNYLVKVPLRWVNKISLNDNLRLEIAYGCFFDFGVSGDVKVVYPAFNGECVINGEKQEVHYDKVVKNFRGNLYDFDNGMLFNIGLSTDNFYTGITYEGGWKSLNYFLFNVGYFLKPCHESVKKEDFVD